MAIEDAVVIGRALTDVANLLHGADSYERARKERTARVQIGSRVTNGLRKGAMPIRYTVMTRGKFRSKTMLC